MIMLALLSLCCLCFTVYDLLVQHIWWSTAAIYLPCIGLFATGLVGWMKYKSTMLALFGVLQILVACVLVVYGVYLCFQTGWWWGPITLGFVAILFPMGLFAITGWQAYRER